MRSCLSSLCEADRRNLSRFDGNLNRSCIFLLTRQPLLKISFQGPKQLLSMASMKLHEPLMLVPETLGRHIYPAIISYHGRVLSAALLPLRSRAVLSSLAVMSLKGL